MDDWPDIFQRPVQRPASRKKSGRQSVLTICEMFTVIPGRDEFLGADAGRISFKPMAKTTCRKASGITCSAGKWSLHFSFTREHEVEEKSRPGWNWLTCLRISAASSDSRTVPNGNAKHERQIGLCNACQGNVRNDHAHKTSRMPVDRPAGIIAFADLRIRNMARRTKPKRGENGKLTGNSASAKAGLNRSTLGSGCGHAHLDDREAAKSRCRLHPPALASANR
jgi:hypothetical protein